MARSAGCSKPWLQHAVDVGAELHWVDLGKRLPAPDERVRRQSRSRDGTELCHGLSGPRDCYLLAASRPINDVATMVAQLANVDLSHRANGITRDTASHGFGAARTESGGPTTKSSKNQGALASGNPIVSPIWDLATATDSARTYARAAASMMSVETPWPAPV